MFQPRQIVYLAKPQPLPNGATVKVRCVVRWIENDGRYTVQGVTPGLYDGARWTVTAAELEG